MRSLWFSSPKVYRPSLSFVLFLKYLLKLQRVSSPYGTPPASRACIDHLRRPSRCGLKSPSIDSSKWKAPRRHGRSLSLSLFVHLRKTEPPARPASADFQRPFRFCVVRSGGSAARDVLVATEAFLYFLSRHRHFPWKVRAVGFHATTRLLFSLF